VNPVAAPTARVDQCRQQRGKQPTILGADFAPVGDLMGMVDRLDDR
jgi:hypothetical protein